MNEYGTYGILSFCAGIANAIARKGGGISRSVDHRQEVGRGWANLILREDSISGQFKLLEGLYGVFTG
jgi:hypothetical protein